jgi:hypothetical protein
LCSDHATSGNHSDLKYAPGKIQKRLLIVGRRINMPPPKPATPDYSQVFLRFAVNYFSLF